MSLLHSHLMGLVDSLGTRPQGQSLHQFVGQAHRIHFVGTISFIAVGYA